MNKVIKVTDNEIFIGKEDGSIFQTTKNNASWNVQVGDVVDLFISGEVVILNLIKKEKKNREFKFLKKLASMCNNIFPIIFSILLVISIAGLITLHFVPRGNVYTYKLEENGVKMKITAKFSDSGLNFSYWVLDADKNLTEDEVEIAFKIIEGDLYTYSVDEEEYIYEGEITSTKLKIRSLGTTMVLKEKYLNPLKVASIVVLVISAILDLASLAVMILIKAKIIKLEKNANAETEISSANANYLSGGVNVDFVNQAVPKEDVIRKE